MTIINANAFITEIPRHLEPTPHKELHHGLETIMKVIRFIGRMIKLYFVTLYKGILDDPLYPRRPRPALAGGPEPDRCFPPLGYILYCEEKARRDRVHRRMMEDLSDDLLGD